MARQCEIGDRVGRHGGDPWPSFFIAAIFAAACLLAPVPGRAARMVQPPPSGIVIHLFDDAPTAPGQPPQTHSFITGAEKDPALAGVAASIAKIFTHNNESGPTVVGRAADMPAAQRAFRATKPLGSASGSAP